MTNFPKTDVEELVRGPITDLLEYSGREVQVVTPRPATEWDEQGDPIDAGYDRTRDYAEIVERGQAGFTERAEGYEVTIEGIAWLPDRVEDTVDVTAGEGDRDQRATEIHDPASGRWRVEYVVNERNGKLRCMCRRLAR